MCCRYYVDKYAEKEVLELADVIDSSLTVRMQVADGSEPVDLHPSDMADVLYGIDRKLHAGQMRWGFPAARSGGLMINARCESALQKPMFSESVMRRRCVIPAAGFYEWDRDKNKVTFFRKQEACIYLAGFYNLFDGEQRFIILTTEANESMSPVHDRMPLILPASEVGGWIHEPDKTKEYLSRRSPLLSRTQEYEQLRLPL